MLKAHSAGKLPVLEAVRMWIKGLWLQKEEKATALVKKHCFLSAPVVTYGHNQLLVLLHHSLKDYTVLAKIVNDLVKPYSPTEEQE